MSSKKKWLVKSSDSIHGPLEFDTVVENIFSGDIHLLDEIKGPFERWRPIRDHSLFAAAIEKLKAATYQQRENTVTETVDLGTRTHEITRSQTITGTERLDGSTFTPAANDSDSGEVTSEVDLSALHAEAPVFSGASQGQQVKTKSRFPAIFFISFFSMILIGAVYLVYEFKQTKLIEQKISAYDQLTDVAMEALRVGEYQKALKNFTMAYNISPQDPNLLVEMSPLSVQFDGQFSQTQALLERMLVNNRQKTLSKVARTVIGLSYSYRELYSESLNAYDQALSVDDQFLPSLLNKAFVLIKLKKFNEAVELMKLTVMEHPDEAVTHYLYIRALMEKGIGEKNPEVLKEALSVSDQFAQRFSDFRQEVLFLISVVHFYLQSPSEEIQAAIDRFLQVDIALTRLHVHDTLIDFQSFNWLDYLQYCEKLKTKVDEYHGQLLEAFCLLKVNRPLDAKKIFEELMSQNNQGGVLQALYASTLFSMNDVSQAKNTLGFINQVDKKKPVVETILRGCLLAGDLSCAEAIFRGEHSKHISLLYSHWGNSEIHYGKNHRKAKSSIVLGLEISPNFAPILKLKKRF